LATDTKLKLLKIEKKINLTGKTMIELTIEHIIFYVFAALAVCSAMVVISVRNPVRSVLALVVTFFSMAGVWMILSAEFLSLILLLVYVGAVMTLFLFVVMMLNIDAVSQQGSGFTRYMPFGVLAILLVVGLMIVAFGSSFVENPVPLPAAEGYSNVTELGAVLYTDYAYPFEIAGVILLAAIVAAISLAHRLPRRRKLQNISAQLHVRPEDRVRLVNMPSEKKK
jgi:NADH-quinone oxidoreductase subunit J